MPQANGPGVLFEGTDRACAPGRQRNVHGPALSDALPAPVPALLRYTRAPTEPTTVAGDVVPGDTPAHPSLMQVGVRMPTSAARLNSIAEVQRIVVSAATRPRQVILKYLYPAATTALATVTVSASAASQLSDARVGLSLTVNGVSVVFPITATASQIDDAIEAALGGVFNATETAFGVYRVRGCVCAGRGGGGRGI